MKQCEGEGQGNCKKCGQRSWMCFLYEVDGAEGCYCLECAKELEKLRERYDIELVIDDEYTNCATFKEMGFTVLRVLRKDNADKNE